MQRLSGLDAAFLALETPAAPLHVLGVAVVKPARGQTAEAYAKQLRRVIAARIGLMAPLRWRLVELGPLAAPLWVDDLHFNLDDHLHRGALIRPGNMRALGDYLAATASQPLDRQRPLWELHIVEGLRYGRIAVIGKFHHALTDGIGGLAVLGALFDLEPDQDIEPRWPSPPFTPRQLPGALERFGQAMVAWKDWPFHASRTLFDFGRNTFGLLGSLSETREPDRSRTGPRLRMNGPIDSRRDVALTQVPLADIKTIKNALGVTVNDVILAIVAGALRTYLVEQGDLPGRPLVVAIPAATQERNASYGNHISTLFANLPVNINDPIDRVVAIAAATTAAKQSHAHLGDTVLIDLAGLVPPVLLSMGGRLFSRVAAREVLPPVANLMVSNVPGPDMPLYLARGTIEAVYPLGPIFDSLGLNITVFSYRGQVNFGLLTCPEVVPHLDTIIRGIQQATKQYLALVHDTERASSPR